MFVGIPAVAAAMIFAGFASEPAPHPEASGVMRKESSMRYLFSLTAALTLGLAGGTFAADGAALFKQNCSSCHGDTGKADKPASKTLKIAPIAGDAKLAGMDEADIVARVKSNDKHTSVMKRLTDADVATVAGYVKALAAGK